MRIRLLASCGMLSVLLTMGLGVAVAANQGSGDGSIATAQRTVVAGDIFEILGVSADSDAQFDWVLTTNGAFVEAGREKMFRTRLIQEGTYTLDGQSVGADTRRLHLTITVTAPREDSVDAQTPPPSSSDALDVVTLDAPVENGTVHLDPEHPLLTLTPSPVFNGPIAADVDTSRDTDGDGDPANDNDTGDTLFSTEHNSLTLWFASPDTSAAMLLSTEADDGTPIRQEMTVTTGASPVPVENIDAGTERHGRVSFIFPIDAGIDPSTTVYQWYFGDGWQSLEDKPMHEFLRNGHFDVSVIVREMATGRLIAQGGSSVDITDVPTIVGSAASASSAKAPSAPPQSSDGGSLLWTIVKILAVLLVAGAVGAGGVWVFRKFMHREGALQKALEAAESKLIKKQPSASADADAAPATLQLKRTEPSTVEVPSAGIESDIAAAKKAEPPAPPAPPPTEAAPAWLQKGLVVAEKQEKSTATSVAPLGPAVTTSSLSAPPPLPGDQFPSERVREKSTPPTPPPSPSAAASPPSPSLILEDSQHPLSEDDLLPPWLREEGTETKKAADTTEVAMSSENRPAVPSVSVSTPPPPTADDTPSWLAELAPVAPTATPPKPEPPVLAPISAPVPAEKPAASVPPSPPISSVPLSTPQPSPTATPSGSDQERLERERERKRRKRQRYRENLKKRNPDTGLRPAEKTDSGSGSDEAPTGPSPSPTPAPIKTETKAIVPVAPPPMPAKIQPKPVAAMKPPTQTPKTTPPANKPAQKPAQKSPAPAPSSKPIVKNGSTKPAANASTQKPIAKDIPKAGTPPVKPLTQSDDKVAFVIKAEGIRKKDEEKNNGNTRSTI